eukprot:m51a1_g6162 hypothetical protein (386) ;mRNA; f:334467-336186
MPDPFCSAVSSLGVLLALFLQAAAAMAADWDAYRVCTTDSTPAHGATTAVMALDVVAVVPGLGALLASLAGCQQPQQHRRQRPRGCRAAFGVLCSAELLLAVVRTRPAGFTDSPRRAWWLGLEILSALVLSSVLLCSAASSAPAPTSSSSSSSDALPADVAKAERQPLVGAAEPAGLLRTPQGPSDAREGGRFASELVPLAVFAAAAAASLRALQWPSAESLSAACSSDYDCADCSLAKTMLATWLLEVAGAVCGGLAALRELHYAVQRLNERSKPGVLVLCAAATVCYAIALAELLVGWATAAAKAGSAGAPEFLSGDDRRQWLAFTVVATLAGASAVVRLAYRYPWASACGNTAGGRQGEPGQVLPSPPSYSALSQAGNVGCV